MELESGSAIQSLVPVVGKTRSLVEFLLPLAVRVKGYEDLSHLARPGRDRVRHQDAYRLLQRNRGTHREVVLTTHLSLDRRSKGLILPALGLFGQVFLEAVHQKLRMALEPGSLLGVGRV